MFFRLRLTNANGGVAGHGASPPRQFHSRRSEAASFPLYKRYALLDIAGRLSSDWSLSTKLQVVISPTVEILHLYKQVHSPYH